MIKFFVLALLLTNFISLVSFAGNEGRGTEDQVLIGLALKMNMSASDLQAFENRKQEIRKTIEGRQWRARLYSFAEQVNPERLSLSFGHAAVAIYAQLQKADLLDDILNSRFVVQESCVDSKGEKRSAATETHLRADICFDVERIALLELVAPLSQMAPHDDLLFGITMHEFARHLDLDDDHTFLLFMAEEASKQFIVEDRTCTAASNICLSGREANTYAVDSSIARTVTVELDISNWVRTKNKKGKTEFKASKCAQENALQFSTLAGSKPHEPLTNKMSDSLADKKARAIFELTSDNLNSVPVDVVNLFNKSFPQKYELAQQAYQESYERWLNGPPGFSNPIDMNFFRPGPFQYPCGDHLPLISIINSSGQKVDTKTPTSAERLPLKFVLWHRPQGFGPLPNF